ncbi:hypothetical protein [Chamaesiphon sp. OTE_20_metabat_361]|uniref:hypothetical protein n=1 Tax=Chamaesiphon sp. OTE_20_metabat_361 TaxID=2964689 RepID=UPI00286D0867|nr:hypothetical protein [Chamaesiphon sp. OTE_20_metabat_361]
MTGIHGIIRQFYQQKLEECNYGLEAVWDSCKDSQIARLELLESGDGSVFDTVEIELINQEAPAPIQLAFERHIWLSQHCLSDVYVVEILTEVGMTYALLVEGYVSDGWDGGCHLIEVFDEVGGFVGAAVCDEDFVWLDQPFDGDAFPGSPPCHWTGSPTVSESTIWSVEKASRTEKSGNITLLVMPWADSLE